MNHKVSTSYVSITNSVTKQFLSNISSPSNSYQKTKLSEVQSYPLSINRFNQGFLQRTSVCLFTNLLESDSEKVREYKMLQISISGEGHSYTILLQSPHPRNYRSTSDRTTQASEILQTYTDPIYFKKQVLNLPRMEWSEALS